ncbi:MAG: hypothetical protein LUF85_12100 [Bacteroides sp.]|nr:hypothetical protein [Bacteroides sp.]
MEHINKYILGVFTVFVCFFTSCSKDNEGTEYMQTNVGVSFYWSNHNVVLIPANEGFNVEILRGDLNGSATISISSTDESGVFSVPSSVTFADGEGVAKLFISVNVEDDLELETNYPLVLSIAEKGQLSPGAIQTATINVTKDYDWILLGTGTFYEYFVSGEIFEVEIYQADGFDRWRVMNPYEGLKSVFPSSYMNKPIPNLDFWITKEGYVYYEPFNIGYKYAGDTEIIAYHPLDFETGDESYNIRLDEKTFQLAPIYNIPGTGYYPLWDDPTIYIELP